MLRIQDFKFKCEHIAGKDNNVADALSRLCASSATSSSTDEVLPTVPAELPIDNTSGGPTLVRLDNSSVEASPLEVLYLEKFPLLQAAHNRYDGHFGRDRMLTKLDAMGHDWPKRTDHVTRFIQNCPICQKTNRRAFHSIGNSFVVSTLRPMEVVAIDTITGFPTTAEGYNSIIVMIDSFTRFVELFPTKDLTARSAASALVNFCSRYGMPKTLLSDNGSQFVNAMVALFCKSAGIQQKQMLAYSHEENAIVERVNGEVIRHVRTMVMEQKSHAFWVEFLPLVQRTINAQPHSSTGYAPYELVFGKRVELNSHLEILREGIQGESVDEWNSRMAGIQLSLLSDAAIKQELKNQKHLDKAVKVTTFDDNSLVLMSYHWSKHHPGLPSKIHPVLQGPYKVLSQERVTAEW